MVEQRVIAPDIVVGTCNDCRTKYDVFSFGDYGSDDWPMKCSKCGHVKWTGALDPFFNPIMERFKNQSGHIYSQDNALNEKAEEFVNELENSCASCDCGGSFQLAVSDICPKCRSRNVNVNWDNIVRQERMLFTTVQHKKGS